MCIDWKEVVYYDESSPSCLRWACNIPMKGTFGNKVAFKRVIGDVAGGMQGNANRYKIKYKQKAYMVHRVIWQLFHGELSKELVIDHIDGDSANNKISNLRAVKHSINTKNCKKRKTNNTGVTGVSRLTVPDKNGNIYNYYTATWFIEKTFLKHFSIDKLGEDLAFQMACDFREQKIKEMNTEGAGYTERHGK